MSGELPCNGSLDLESDLKLADWLGDDLPAFLTDLVGEVLEDLWGETLLSGLEGGYWSGELSCNVGPAL